ncbi:esterase/lipase family protein [Paucibacter soli]|uniref:esterase/lipase family protein n=1 Tax=Paucibacter soli TaxID=3133433 RepID=UPI0030AF0D79
MAGVNARWQRLHLGLRLLLAAAAFAWGLSRWGLWQGFGLALAVLSLQQIALLPVFFWLRSLPLAVGVPRLGRWQTIAAWWRECDALERVFSWQQPFFEHAEPDHLPTQSAQRGVLLLHGFTCNRGLWNPWMRQLRALGQPFMALTLEPAFGSIDAYVPAIDAALRRLEACGGPAPIIVAHSMGGLAARAWWRHVGHDGSRVHRVVTLGSPHAGTLMARFSSAANARQMRRGSPWLATLAQLEQAQHHQRFDCFFSHADQIVCPAGTAALPGARNHHVQACGHLSLVFDADLRAAVMALLQDEKTP